MNPFAKLVEKSGLVDQATLRLCLEESHSEKEVENWLSRRNHLSPWQVEQLRQGRWKGFFLGQHRIVRLLAKGGHSKVYEVIHQVLQQRRVLKVLTANTSQSESSMLARFQQEARSIAKLTHPNVVQCLDIVNEDSIHYLVLEFLDGLDLEEFAKRNHPLPYPLIVNLIQQAAIGLRFANQQGLIHRDVKPKNLFYTKSKVVKVLDFGLAMVAHDSRNPSLTIMHNDNLGTPDYIAPEQALNSHDVDLRADIYSLGCTLYFLITGVPPFGSGSAMERIINHQTRMPRRIFNFRNDCPPTLEKICWKMIQKKPEQRFQNYDQLIRGLKNYQVITNSKGTAKANSSSVDVGGLEVMLAEWDKIKSDTPVSSPSTSISTQFDPQKIQGSSPQSTQPHFPSSTGHSNPLGLTMGSSGMRPQGTSEDAYHRFIQRERLKMLWVVIGIALGLGVALGSFTILKTIQKSKQESTPPSLNKER